MPISERGQEANEPKLGAQSNQTHHFHKPLSMKTLVFMSLSLYLNLL